MIHGAACRAFRKISLTPFSDSPTHFESNSGPLTLMKWNQSFQDVQGEILHTL